MKRLKRKRRFKRKPSMAQRAIHSLRAWLKKKRACRPTPVSARHMRIVRCRFREDEPDMHREEKLLRRTERMLARKLNSARVSWARKLWTGRRKAEGKSTNDRCFPGAFKPSPRLKPLVHKLRGSTRTPSPKLRLSKYRHDQHPMHQSRRVDTSPRTGCYAQVRDRENG